MKLWLLNPRAVAKPIRTGGTTTVVEVDCPCGCGFPFILPPIAGFEPPAAGSQLTQLQWRLALNGYSLNPIHRVLNGATRQCGWDGRIVAGRVFYRDLGSGDDTPFGAKVQETLERLAARENIRGR